MENTLQDKIFNKILSRYSSKAAAIRALTDLLYLSKSNIYRRINGEIELKSSEIDVLISHFGFSLDELIYEGKSDYVLLEYKHLKVDGQPDLSQFLQQILDELTAIQRLEHPVITFLTNDLPIFYTFSVPELAIFKLYVWRETIWNKSYREVSPFSFQLLTPEVSVLLKKIAAAYVSIPRVEFWSDKVLDVLLRQIKYYTQIAQSVSIKDGELLLRKLDLLVQQLKPMAVNTRKGSSKKYTLYINNAHNMGNHIMVTSATDQTAYLLQDNPHFLKSVTPSMIGEIEETIGQFLASQAATQQNKGFLKLFFDSLSQQIKTQLAALSTSLFPSAAPTETNAHHQME